MIAEPTTFDLFLRLGLAVLLGGMLGLERETQAKPAGLRTHMMVSLGAAIFTIAAVGLQSQSGPEAEPDVTRAVQGVAGGIGFLGAGSILRGENGVQGLTTAASIWSVGAVGVACGAGELALAGMGVGFALTVLLAVGWIERSLLRRPPIDDD